jgi:fermentation-respiration switch protein FrsA (DUF1100 family)
MFEIIIVIVCITLVALLIIGFYFTKVSFFPKTYNHEETYKQEIAYGFFEDLYYKNLIKHEFYIDSEFNYKLYGIWFPNNDSAKTIIIVHGYTVNLNASIRYLQLFFDKGYNVLLYDQRYHGNSEGKNCTMGYYEKFDLKTWVTWVLNKTGKDSTVGVHGESMGASTAIMHAAIDDRTSFVISDCAFANLYKQFGYRLKTEYKLPAFPVLLFANLATKIMTNVFYQDVSPIDDITKINIPILFIHGDSDTFTLCSNTINMYNKKKGIKELYISKDSDHAQSLYVNKSEYKRVVYSFLDSLDAE